MKKVKVKLLNNGGYIFKHEGTPEFPVVVGGYTVDYRDGVFVYNEECLRIGMAVFKDSTVEGDFWFSTNGDAEIIE